jgi:DHA2 family multidrug resistance protein-like MFS transporter
LNELDTRDGLHGAQRLLAMCALSIGVGMASLDTAIVNTALPGVGASLQATPAASVWIINIYQLAMIATMLPFAALGEIVGYRRVCIAGLALFTAASLGCAAAWSLPSLVAARLLQGLGASAVMGVNTALLKAIYPTRQMGRGMGANALIVATGFAIGPTAASLILSLASWPWLFAINVPLGLTGLVLASRFLPQTRRASHRFDVRTAVFNALAFGLLVLAMGEGAHAAPAPVIAAELAGAALFFLLLLRRQRGHPAPMLPIDLFRRPLFALSVVTAVCTFAAQGLAFVSLPFYFEHVLGRSPVETGFLITPWAVMVGVMAPIAGRLSDRYQPGLLGGAGLLALSLGLLSLLLMPADPGSLAICWRMGLCGVGFGFFQAPNLKAIMSAAPAARAGGASGIVATSRLVGQAGGAALVALCFTLAGSGGTAWALGLGAASAALASIASFARLAVQKT